MSKLRQRNKIYSLSHKCFAQTRPARPTLDSNAFRNGEKLPLRAGVLPMRAQDTLRVNPETLLTPVAARTHSTLSRPRMTGTARYSACPIYVIVPLPPKFIAKVHRTLPMTVRRAYLPLVV